MLGFTIYVYGAFGLVLKLDSDSVFDVAASRQMCGRMGIDVQFSAPYAHYMLGKEERPWRTRRDNAYVMMHNMYVLNSMCSCAVNTGVYLRNSTFSRAVGPSGGVPLTRMIVAKLNTFKFRAFNCTVFPKARKKLRRKLDKKKFWSVVVGELVDAKGYRMYNPVTHRITTSVHVMFQESVPGFGVYTETDSSIFGGSGVNCGSNTIVPLSHTISPPPQMDVGRPSPIMSHPVIFGDLVAHVSGYPPVFVTSCYVPKHGKDIMQWRA
jgi:hypothetical protein